MMPSPVKQAAVDLGIPVTSRVDDVLDVGADLGVVVAFGRLIKPRVLEVLPMVNVHFSLLPRWRGAAPVERAILAGDDETGVCVMQLEEGLDTGPVHALERTPIGAEETVDELRDRLVAIGTPLLVATLQAGVGDGAPQVGEPSYASKIDPAELEVDWTGGADAVHRLIRLGSAWTTFRGKRLRVRRAHRSALPPSPAGALGEGAAVGTGDGALQLVTVQPEGKAPMDAAAWARGARLSPGEHLGG